MSGGLKTFANGTSVRVKEIAHVEMSTFRDALLATAVRGARRVALFPLRPMGRDRALVAGVALDGDGVLGAISGILGGAAAYPSLTPDWP